METKLLPCPPWCLWPAGHPYTDEALDGSYVLRFHEDGRDLGAVFPELGPAGAYGRQPLSVGISCEEQALGGDGPAVRAAPVITLWAENPVLTAEETRQLAAVLHEAADRLDALNGHQDGGQA